MIMKQMPYKIEPGAIERAKIRSRAAIYAADSRRRSVRRVQLAMSVAVLLAVLIVAGVNIWPKDNVQSSVTTPEPTPMELLIAEVRQAPDELLYDMTLDSSLYIEESDSFSDLL